jgi:hypothetical protein
MPDYRNGMIYMIKAKDENIKQVYIGSTCNFTRRKCMHKSNCCNPNTADYDYPVYKFIRANGGWYEFEMVKVKDFPCNIKKELETEERKVMLEYGFDNCLNKNKPLRTKTDLKEWQKEYHEDNKVRIHQYKNKKNNCICGGKYTTANKAQHIKSIKHIKYIESN